MTDVLTTARARPSRRFRRIAATASAAIALTLVPTVGTAGAITFTDPADRCLPGADAPAAPVSDRNRIDPVHIPSVDCTFAQGISTGLSDGTFDPTGMTSRGQMASFIARALDAAGYDLPAPGPGFGDTAGTTHEDAIRRLRAAGIVAGRTADTYAPSQTVTRDQMATFLVQAAEWAFGQRSGTTDGVGDFLSPNPPAFADVTAANVHYDNVNTAAQVLGLADGKTTQLYDPANPVQRQQMASFLVRLVDLLLLPPQA